MITSNVYWHSPKDRVPTKAQSVLVIYNGLVWAGGYINGKVIRFPEDYPSIKLDECELWTSFPEVPVKEYAIR